MLIPESGHVAQLLARWQFWWICLWRWCAEHYPKACQYWWHLYHLGLLYCKVSLLVSQSNTQDVIMWQSPPLYVCVSSATNFQLWLFCSGDMKGWHLCTSYYVLHSGLPTAGLVDERRETCHVHDISLLAGHACTQLMWFQHIQLLAFLVSFMHVQAAAQDTGQCAACLNLSNEFQ